MVMQRGVVFNLSRLECERLVEVFDLECRSAAANMMASRIRESLLYSIKSSSQNTINLNFETVLGYELLDRLLAACPDLASSCGARADDIVENQCFWSELGLRSPEIRSACKSVLHSLGFVFEV